MSSGIDLVTQVLDSVLEEHLNAKNMNEKARENLFQRTASLVPAVKLRLEVESAIDSRLNTVNKLTETGLMDIQTAKQLLKTNEKVLLSK